MIGDITPRSPVDRLRRDFRRKERQREFDAELVAAVVGMSRAFMARALEQPGTRPKTITLDQVLTLLDVDGFQETFIPRSKIPGFLLDHSSAPPSEIPGPRRAFFEEGGVRLLLGDARALLPRLDPQSVQTVVTSSPYWGMRLYDDVRATRWADGESCPYGFEQTPEAFIRHTIELLVLLKPAIATKGSVWWNIMDTYNTRTPIRSNARERLDEMGKVPESRKGWLAHDARRHSAGHMYLDDAELSSIPSRIAERASRVGYNLKSFITWRKHTSTPEPAKSRVSRQAEYLLHLSVDRTPFFDREAWQERKPRLGGPNRYESTEKITDVWCLPTSSGKNGHGAQFPLALAARCITLTSKPGDLVLDPFVGMGTTAVAALELRRRCLAYDISETYVSRASELISTALRQMTLDVDAAKRSDAAPEDDGVGDAESEQRAISLVEAV